MRSGYGKTSMRADYYLQATQSAHRRELWRQRLEVAKLLLLLVALCGMLVAIWVAGRMT